MDLSNACYYTFSTVCQTLAGAFGFLVAVVLFRLQGIGSRLQPLYETTLHGYVWDPQHDPAIKAAYAERDFFGVAEALGGADLPPNSANVPKERRDEQIRRRDQYVGTARLYHSIQKSTRYALRATTATVGTSLILLPLTPWIAPVVPRAMLAMSAAVFMAVVCLVMYFRLAKGMVT